MDQAKSSGLLPEKPIATRDQDLVDRCWFSDAVARFALQSKLPIALAMLGEWGSGKTSMLKLVQEALGDNEIVIYFNAWRSECGDSTGLVLLRKVLSTLETSPEDKAQIGSVLRDYGERDAVGIAEFEDQLELHVVEALKRLGKERIILLVDDLDRCRPAALVSLLEALALNVLSTNMPIAIVAALDYKHACKAYDTYLGNNDGEKYLSRVFTMMVRLPTIELIGWRQLLLNRFPELGKAKDFPSLSDAVGRTATTIREFKKHLNEIQFWLAIDEEDTESDPLPLDLIVRWYFIVLIQGHSWGILSGGRVLMDIELTDLSTKEYRTSAEELLCGLMTPALVDEHTIYRLGRLELKLGRISKNP